MRIKKRRLSGILPGLALILGLVTGISMMAKAGEGDLTSDLYPYSLVVSSIPVNDNNKDNVLGDSNKTVSFTPAAGETPATLKLNGASITEGFQTGSLSAGIFYTGTGPLNIELVSGSKNRITSVGGTPFFGIVAQNFVVPLGGEPKKVGPVTITGGGSLTVDPVLGAGSMADDLIINSGVISISPGTVTGSGIVSNKSLNIKGGTVNIDVAGDYCVGIDTSGADMFITGGTVTISAIGTECSGIMEYQDTGTISVSGGKVEITAAGADSFGIRSETGISIGENAAFVCTGGSCAVDGKVRNAIAGTGWTDTEGTRGKTGIGISTAGQTLNNYKKVRFPVALPTVTTVPKARDLTYTGSAQTLATAGSASDGTMQYALGTTAAAAPAGGWSSSIPTGINAGTYYVWYKAKGNDNQGDSEPGYVEVIIKKADPVTPAGLTAVYGQTLADVALPAGWTWANSGSSVGEVGNNSFKANYTATDTNHNSVKNVDVSVLVTKAGSVVTTAPAALELIYNSQAQALVTAGEAAGGQMQYALGTDAAAPVESAYTSSIPAATDAGTYFVWYKVVGDANHVDSNAAGPVQVEIGQRSIAAAAVTLSATSLPYTGAEQTVTVSSVMLGDLTLSANDYDVSGTAGTNQGTYTVTVTGKGNYRDTAAVSWSIGLAEPAIVTPPAASAITEGQMLSESTLTGGAAALGEQPVVGTFAWMNPETKPSVSDSQVTAYDVVFTPADQNNFATAACKVTLTVNQAIPAEQPQTEQPQTEQPQTEQPQTETPSVLPAADPALELLSGFLVVCRDSKLHVSYGLVSGADSYDIYVGYCGGKKSEKVMTVTGGKAVIQKLHGKKLDMTRSFVVYVAAMAGGREIARTFTAHVAGRKHETYTNVKKSSLKSQS